MLQHGLPARIWTHGRRALGFRMGVGMGVAIAVVACCGVGRAAEADTATTVENLHQQFFESRVRPLLATKCQECHGAGIAEAGLRLDSRQALIRGADSGPVVVPGKANESRLLAVVRHADDIAMPPEGKLSDDEISVLETWISAGAPWSGPGGDDDTSAPAAGPVDMQQRLKDALRDHWAFQPLLRHEPPAPPPQAPPEWTHSRIDRFILAAATAAGVSPSPAASPRDLVRRVWFDLTGMPPPAAEVDAFAAQPTEESYEALVDRLLASRHHAEHWARKWLDVARYADTMGYAFDSQDKRYPFAWTYRDWVVSALAADRPYDQFITLQIAADLVVPPVPPSDLAALGFLTVGRSFLGNTNDIIDDRIDLVTRGLMGLTVACARCHDHKYEPVTTADYYALHGIFASCQIPEELPEIGSPSPGPEGAAFAATYAELRQAVTDHETAVRARAVREAVAHSAAYFLEVARPAVRGADKRPPRLADGYELQQLIIDKVTRLVGGQTEQHPILGPWVAAASGSDAEVPSRLARLLDAEAAGQPASNLNTVIRDELVSARPGSLAELAEAYGRIVMRVAPDWAGGPAVAGDESDDVRAVRELLGAAGTPFVVQDTEAMRVANMAEQTEFRRRQLNITKHQAEAAGGPPRAMVLIDRPQPQDSPILLRGSPARRGDVVKRRMPMLLGGAEVGAGSSGRLDLARALVAPGNPLTARMIVNWAWTHHLGGGLVPAPGDLGLRGEAPAHRELLDDLARRFVDEGGWSLRWLHREIVTSRTFRQSSAAREDLADRDPDNRLFARANRRRLDWEAWRDSMLVAADTLDRVHCGGPGVDPLAVESMSVRSIYGRLDRQDVPGLLRTFDVANPDTAVHVRVRTTVPQQSLAVLNSELVVNAARRLAARVQAEVPDPARDDLRVDSLWRAALSRSPSAEERDAALAWLAAEPPSDTSGFGRYERLAQAVLAVAEFQFID